MLLALRHVGFHHERRGRAETLLRDVSLDLDAGDFVAVLGADRGQRTALLHVCAGMQPIRSGAARFDGAPLTSAVLGKPGGIGLAHTAWSAGAGGVSGQVALPLMMRARSVADATARAREQLERVGAGDLAHVAPEDLLRHERLRVAIARALIAEPRLLVLDAATDGLSAGERDAVLRLLRSLSSHERLGVLIAVDEPVGLGGRVDRTLRMHRGELHGAVAPRPATVHELRLRRSGPA